MASRIYVEVAVLPSENYTSFDSANMAFKNFGIVRGVPGYWDHQKIRPLLRADGETTYKTKDGSGRVLHFRRV